MRVLCAFKPRSVFRFSLFLFGRAQLFFLILIFFFLLCFFIFRKQPTKHFFFFLFFFLWPSMIIVHSPAVNNYLIYSISFLLFSPLLYPIIPDHNQTTIIYTCLSQQTIVYLIIFCLASLIFFDLYCVVQDEEGIVNQLFMHLVNNQGMKSDY